MIMSEAAIVKSFKGAAVKKTQIHILAQMNCCSKELIKDVLKRNGIPEEDIPSSGPGRPTKEKNDTPEKVAPKKEEPEKVAPKKEEPEKVAPKKEVPKKEEPQKVESQKPKKAELKKDDEPTPKKQSVPKLKAPKDAVPTFRPGKFDNCEPLTKDEHNEIAQLVIPSVVRSIVENRIAVITAQVIALEKERDTLCDYLGGVANGANG